jgi:hypothetical protein
VSKERRNIGKMLKRQTPAPDMVPISIINKNNFMGSSEIKHAHTNVQVLL